MVARKLSQIVFGILVFAILARALSKEQFATYTLIFSVVSVLRLLALPGMEGALAQSFARGYKGSFSQALRLSLFGTLIGSMLLLLGAYFYYQIDEQENTGILIATAFFFPLLVGVCHWRPVLLGTQDYKSLFIFEVASHILKCAIIIAAAYYYPNYLLIVMIAAFIAPSIINLSATIKLLSEIPENAKCEKGIIRYGWQTTFYQIPSVAAAHLDKIILFYFIAPEALAIYAVALRIPELARGVVFEINATLAPIFAKQKEYSNSIKQFTWLLCLFYLLVSIIGAWLVIPYILPLLAGEQYADSTFYAQIMTIGIAFGYLANLQFRFVKSHLDSETFLKITLVKAATDLFLVVICVSLWGLLGAVIAYVCKGLIKSILVNSIMNRKLYLDENFVENYK